MDVLHCVCDHFHIGKMIKISIIFLLLCVRNIQKNGRNTGRFLMISTRYVDDPVPASRSIPAFRKHTQYIIIKAVKWFFFHASKVFEILCIQRICLLFLWINWSFPFFSIQLTLNQTIHTNAPYSYGTYVKIFFKNSRFSLKQIPIYIRNVSPHMAIISPYY